MSDSYNLRLPYKGVDPFDDKYILNERDIQSIKKMAKSEGRSVRTFIAYKLKEIAKQDPSRLMSKVK